MDELPEASTDSLMPGAPAPDALQEQLALATLERNLFGRRTPAPVLDRYVLLERIGAGGLGVVFRAYDPDLDRQVALKLLRLRDADARPEASDLLDEARLMAQVSHPNVVTIYDVGTYGRSDLGVAIEREDALGIPIPGVFLVMELMEHGSLRDRLRERPSVAELMPMLIAAGRGLSAAHEQGIVHRDFKPSNVLLGADGRVHVGDFGLALSSDAQAEHDLAGTPAYMAPEQLDGGAADARSDQYAFALTCYVALYGSHPFENGASRDQTLPAPDRHGRHAVPRRVHAVLQRGLLVDPAARYPEMSVLVDALEAASTDRTRQITLVAATGILVAGGLALWRPAESPDACAQADAAIDPTWDDDAREGVRSAFARSDAPFAASSRASVEHALDDYAARWRAASRESCADTHVRHVQSETLLDQRGACLERLRLEFEEVVRLLQDPDPALQASAMQVVHGLGWIDACADPMRLTSTHLPDDPATRTAMVERWGRLGRARMLELSGRYTDAEALASSALDEAQAISDPSLVAAAHVRLGSIAARRGRYEQARTQLLSGIQGAEAIRDDALAVDGWIRLLWVCGVELQDGQGDIWADFARAALQRLGNDPMRHAQFEHNLGGVAYRDRRLGDALSHYQRALDTQQQLLSANDPRIARTLNHIANVLLEMDQPEPALRHAQRSLTIREQVLGDEHPLVAASLNNIASAHLDRGALRSAEDAITRALDITRGRDLPEEVITRTLQRRLLARQSKEVTEGADE